MIFGQARFIVNQELIKHTDDEKAEDEDLHVRNSVKLLGKEEQTTIIF